MEVKRSSYHCVFIICLLSISRLSACGAQKNEIQVEIVFMPDWCHKCDLPSCQQTRSVPSSFNTHFITIYWFYVMCLFRYPVILSIENHCSIQQQKKIAQYLRDIFADKLDVRDALRRESKTLPSPHTLQGKILIKVRVNQWVIDWDVWMKKQTVKVHFSRPWIKVSTYYLAEF